MDALNAAMQKLRVLAAVCVLGGCATPAAGPIGPAGDLPQLAMNVAAQLEQAAAGDPARLQALELELRRISDALPLATGAEPLTVAALAPATPAPEPAAVPEPEPAEAYAPPPELAGARSLFSALTLGAYPNADTARAAWFGMNAAHGEALAGLDARIEAITREDDSAAYVLKAGPFASAQEAETLCARLRSAGAVCTAGDFTGEPL